MTPCTMLELPISRPGKRAEEHEGWSEEVIQTMLSENFQKSKETPHDVLFAMYDANPHLDTI